MHRDLKPSNLYVVDDVRGPRLKILDFGIAKVMSGMKDGARPRARTAVTGSTPRFFSPAYGAPEQFEVGRWSTGPWTDVYALALVLIALVEGREPYKSQGKREREHEALDRANRPSFSEDTPVNEAVRSVMRRALAVDPAYRFRDAGEFWTELMRALRGDVRVSARVETEPVSVPEPGLAPRPARSRPESQVQVQSTTGTTSPVTATPSGPSARRPRWLYSTVAALLLVAAAVPLRTYVATPGVGSPDVALSRARRLETALAGGDSRKVAAIYAEPAMVFGNSWDRRQIESFVEGWWGANRDSFVHFTACRPVWHFENSQMAACDVVVTRQGKPLADSECQIWSDDGLLELRENGPPGVCTEASQWSNRCYLYVRARRYEWAKIACDEGLRANPGPPETQAQLLNNAGMVACALGKFDEARDHFSASLDLPRKDARDRITVAAAREALPRCLLP